MEKGWGVGSLRDVRRFCCVLPMSEFRVFSVVGDRVGFVKFGNAGLRCVGFETRC